jgi:hypothetical protein
MLKFNTLFLLIGLAACGGKTDNPLDDGGANDGGVKKDVAVFDVGPPIDAFPPPPLDGAPPPQCNNIDPGTKVISIMQVAQDPPPFAGTSTFIQPGLYELVSATIYTGPTGPSGSTGSVASEIRVNVANSADYIFQAATVQDNQAPTWSNSDGNNVGPGVLTLAQTCPQPQQAVKVQYAADSTAFVIRVAVANETAESKFDYIGP